MFLPGAATSTECSPKFAQAHELIVAIDRTHRKNVCEVVVGWIKGHKIGVQSFIPGGGNDEHALLTGPFDDLLLLCALK